MLVCLLGFVAYTFANNIYVEQLLISISAGTNTASIESGFHVLVVWLFEFRIIGLE